MTTNKKIENAIALYLEGIRDGNAAEAIHKYTGDRYTQHSAGVPDGKEGFLEFFQPFLERNPVRDIQVLRTIEDGQYVFCHVYQNLNNGAHQWVTADLFDTDDRDRMIEHWDVIQAFVPKNASGHSMTDGETRVEDLDSTEDNKAVVGRYVEDVLVGGNADGASKYVSEQYAEHSPSTASAQYIKVHRLIGQGNFVVTYSHTKVNGQDHAVFDLFRLQGGSIVEHWDVQEKIAPKSEWKNSGKF